WNAKDNVVEYPVCVSKQRWNAKDNVVEYPNNQKQGNARAMVTSLIDGNVSSGLLPLCERCFTRRVGPCTIKYHKCGKVGHKAREVRGRAYAVKDAEPKGSNVVTGMFLLNNHYAFVLFDLGSDKSFVDTRFSFMLNIDPIKI
nr:reverse transcriptase domain-containing protein [Tanacetum cinerariifolium]